MKSAMLAIAASAALVLAAPPSEAGRGHGFAGGHARVAAGVGGVHHFAHFHGGTRVFIGGTFVAWPGYYYPAPYYYAPPPVAAPVTYWYYCAPLAAYYPYVRDCPSGWQLVPAYPGY